jgi:hypothetical protein
MRRNLLWDQGVGDSNPLSPINVFKHIVLPVAGRQVLAQVVYVKEPQKHWFSRDGRVQAPSQYHLQMKTAITFQALVSDWAVIRLDVRDGGVRDVAHRPPFSFSDNMVTGMKEMELSRLGRGREHISHLRRGLSGKLARDLVDIGKFWISLGVSILKLSFRTDTPRFAHPTYHPRHPSEPWRHDA